MAYTPKHLGSMLVMPIKCLRIAYEYTQLHTPKRLKCFKYCFHLNIYKLIQSLQYIFDLVTEIRLLTSINRLSFQIDVKRGIWEFGGGGV